VDLAQGGHGGERTEWPEAVVARASAIALGTVRFFAYPGPDDPCILVRRTNGEFTAFSQKCTHLSCAVYYAPARDRLECPVPRGVFLRRRRPRAAGTAAAAAAAGTLEQRGDDIVAVGMITARRNEGAFASRPAPPRVAIDAAMVMIIVVLMVQMWLLTATLESYLAGHHRVALPALLSTAALFGVCVFLYRLVLRIDRMPDAAAPPQGGGRAGPWRIGA
jgi:hypothetical protein